MSLEKLRDQVKKINLSEISLKVILKFKEEIIDFNTSQLAGGVDSNDSFLPEYASDDYFAAKKAEGKATAGRRYNLKLDGDFTDDFVITSSSEDVTITSKDSKRDYLVSLTSEDIFGLTDDNLNEFIQDYFLPEFLDEIRRQLGLL